LFDFGLVKFRSRNEEQNPNTISGTPTFIAPEKIERKDFDHRADLYAVGVMLYKALSGDYPFDGKTPVEILQKHVSEIAAPLTERCKIPEGVSEIVMRALEKDPNKRFVSAVEMRKAIELN
jgi:serine/threonine-protein kinase